MGKATRKFENSPIISTLISRFRLHAMHVDVSTINHKFDKRVPSFSFYFLASSQRKFQQRDRERERRGGRSDPIRDSCERHVVGQGRFFQARAGLEKPATLAEGKGGEEGGAQKTAQRRVEQFYGEVFALCTVENPRRRSLSWTVQFATTSFSNSGKTNSVRSPCVYKKGEKLLGVCTVCLLLIYYAVLGIPPPPPPIIR